MTVIEVIFCIIIGILCVVFAPFMSLAVLCFCLGYTVLGVVFLILGIINMIMKIFN